MLLCFVVCTCICITLLASSFLPSASLINMYKYTCTCMYYIHACIHVQNKYTVWIGGRPHLSFMAHHVDRLLLTLRPLNFSKRPLTAQFTRRCSSQDTEVQIQYMYSACMCAQPVGNDSHCYHDREFCHTVEPLPLLSLSLQHLHMRIIVDNAHTYIIYTCTLLASFFLPSHLSFKNMYMYIQQ